MAYSSWSVVFGEQPSTAKWNILGANDASFNDGTGIFGLKKDLLVTDSNPYKFSVYKSANQTGITDLVDTKVTWDTENFDTNNNFASDKYTVPVTGFYQINCYIRGESANNTGVALTVYMKKNGATPIANGGSLYPTVGSAQTPVSFGVISGLFKLTAGDYLEIFINFDVGSSTATVAGTQQYSSFSGFLVSRT
jgi:hypothetical protein